MILPRTCRECGCTFQGGPRAWFCQSCGAKRRKLHDREMKMRRKSGNYIPLGSIINCADCGKEIVKTSGRLRRCPECAALHLTNVDRKQSLEWKQTHPEEAKEAKRKLARKRIEHGEIKKSGIKGISWDKSTLRWKVSIYKDGKQIYLGKYKELQEAIAALEAYRTGDKNEMENR